MNRMAYQCAQQAAATVPSRTRINTDTEGAMRHLADAVRILAQAVMELSKN